MDDVTVETLHSMIETFIIDGLNRVFALGVLDRQALRHYLAQSRSLEDAFLTACKGPAEIDEHLKLRAFRSLSGEYTLRLVLFQRYYVYSNYWFKLFQTIYPWFNGTHHGLAYNVSGEFTIFGKCPHKPRDLNSTELMDIWKSAYDKACAS